MNFIGTLGFILGPALAGGLLYEFTGVATFSLAAVLMLLVAALSAVWIPRPSPGEV